MQKEQDLLAHSKACQRRAGIAARKALAADERAAANDAICRRLSLLPEWRAARTVLAYAAFGGEADLQTILSGCDKQVAYPVCGDGFTMTAALPAVVDGWETGLYGIRTPVLQRAEQLCPEELDLVLVPCTAFDAQCRRVGMGKGYYDRYLPRCSKAFLLGVAFEAQRVEQAAADELDCRLDCVITEKGLYRWNG